MPRKRKSTFVLVIPRFEGRKGHPVLLRATFVEKLLAVGEKLGDEKSSDARLDRQIQKLSKDQVSIVDVDSPEVTMNLNFLADFVAYQSRAIPSHKSHDFSGKTKST